MNCFSLFPLTFYYENVQIHRNVEEIIHVNTPTFLHSIAVYVLKKIYS